MKGNGFEKYLNAGFFINSDHPEVIKFTLDSTDNFLSIREKIEAVYYAVRDGFRYDPYRLDFSIEAVRASNLVTRDYGYCVEKSCLFAAAARVLGVPSRMGFAKVRNHIGSKKLQEILLTDVLVFHGYTELWLNDKWIKATPVFNKSLCEKLNVAPLEFNGEDSSILQSFDEAGGQFMEYLYDYGTYDDVPYEFFISELIKHYPHLRDSIITTKKNNRIC